jgi:methyl-accepting chemotaxis protein
MDQISSEITNVSETVDTLSVNAGGLREKGQDVMSHIENVVTSSKDNTRSSHTVKSSISETVLALDRLMASSQSLEDAIGNL